MGMSWFVPELRYTENLQKETLVQTFQYQK